MVRQLWGKLSVFAVLGLPQMTWEQTFSFVDSPQVQLTARGQEVIIGMNPETYSQTKGRIGVF